MATVYFTNNADSGDGSLREAWANASSGDVIMPDPNVFTAGSTIEILLASNWSLRALDLTLDGGNYRIILNGQDAYRFGTGSSASIVHTYKNVDLKNFSYTGTGSTAVQYPLYISNLGSLTFTNCRFYGNHCASGATSTFMRTTSLSSASITMNNCLAYNNGSTATARFVQSSVGTFVINGCTFVSSIYGTVTNNDSILSSDSDFANAGFADAANNDYRLTAGSPYLTGGTLTGSDFLGHTRSGTKGAYDGSWLVVGSSGSTTVSANTTVDYAELSGALTFSGTDRVLAVAKGATIGAATFSAATDSNGYLAVPAGTSTSAATFSGVKAANYGAGASNLTATTRLVSWSATDSTVPVLLESNGATIALTAGTSYPVNLSANAPVRLFDGVQFLTATAEPVLAPIEFHPWGVYDRTISVETTPRYIVVTGFLMMSQYYNAGETPVLFARVVDSSTGTIIDPADVESVSYTCFQKSYNWATETKTPVEGHEDATIPTTAVLSALVANDSRWTIDTTGYNFIYEPDGRTNPLFPEPGDYEIIVTIEFENANPIPVVFVISVS